MKLSFQPPEEDDPRDDDQRAHETLRPAQAYDAISPAPAAPAPEAAHTEAVALSSMPDLQAIVKAGLEDGSLEIRGATSAAPAPEQSEDTQLLDWLEQYGLEVRANWPVPGDIQAMQWIGQGQRGALRNALRAARKAQGSTDGQG